MAVTVPIGRNRTLTFGWTRFGGFHFIVCRGRAGEPPRDGDWGAGSGVREPRAPRAPRTGGAAAVPD